VISLELHEVSSGTLETIRLIRNECRLFMTNNQEEITKSQQVKWFSSLPSNIKPFIAISSNIAIGYAILKIEDSSCLLTGGLVESVRGKGYGRMLFQKLIDLSIEMGKEPRLDVLQTNEKAIRLYSSLGFKVFDKNDKIYMMRYV